MPSCLCPKLLHTLLQCRPWLTWEREDGRQRNACCASSGRIRIRLDGRRDCSLLQTSPTAVLRRHRGALETCLSSPVDRSQRGEYVLPQLDDDPQVRRSRGFPNAPSRPRKHGNRHASMPMPIIGPTGSWHLSAVCSARIRSLCLGFTLSDCEARLPGRIVSDCGSGWLLLSRQ
jgi:hypothetical protein